MRFLKTWCNHAVNTFAVVAVILASLALLMLLINWLILVLGAVLGFAAFVTLIVVIISGVSAAVTHLNT